MKALFIGPNLAAGGSERQSSILLPGLRSRGIDARLIAIDGGGPFEQPLRAAGVPIEILHMRHQADLASLARSRLIRGFAPDVVVSRSVSGMCLGHAIARWRGARHVHSEHRQVGLALSRRREAMIGPIARRLDLVITVSPGQAGQWLRRRYPASRMVVVPNGVPAPAAPGGTGEPRRELGIPRAAVVALVVARLRPEKCVPGFVRAIQIARRSNPQLVGLIAGDGPDRSAVQTAIAGDAGVRLLGHRDDIAELLQAADLFVLASDFEAVPMAILEAMGAGLPILSTDVGGISQVVTTGESGLLVPPRDERALVAALLELAGDPALRARMGAAAARTHRERFDAATMIDRYAEILAGLPDAPRVSPKPGSTSEPTFVSGATNRKSWT
jgi:glycosyltransferase involved in cell wall biosynthesis